jgi:hypothetical protein
MAFFVISDELQKASVRENAGPRRDRGRIAFARCGRTPAVGAFVNGCAVLERRHSPPKS